MDKISDLLRQHNNDYSLLEKSYREFTRGGELVTQPFNSPRFGLSNITKTVSIVISVWNARHSIQQCLKAIELSSFNSCYPNKLEVILVDDGSTDDTWKIIKGNTWNLNLQCVHQKNTGQYRALNTGFSIASGDIIISVDDDMILTPYTIEELVKRHELFNNVLLIGFRYDVDQNNPNVQPQRIKNSFHSLLPLFEGDNRITFHWPGYPAHLNVETNHLKSINGLQRIWTTDGESLDGDFWSLPRMVYGALFSLSRECFYQMDGYDEKLAGWGWGDTTIGIKAIALGNYVIPVYSAVGLHIAHPDRSSKKWDEADENFRILEALLNQPYLALQSNSPVIQKASQRILETKRDFHDTTVIPVHSSIMEMDNYLFRPEVYASHNYSIGNYEKAVCEFNKLVELDPANWIKYGVASKEIGQLDRAVELLRNASLIYPKCASLRVHLAIMVAEQDKYSEASLILNEALPIDPCDGWVKFFSRNRYDDFIRRGDRYLQENLYMQALRDYKLAMIYQPNSKEGRVRIEKVKQRTFN